MTDRTPPRLPETGTEHEAGRELDALVAEKVLGYEWCRSETTPPAGYDGPNGHLLSPWRWLVSRRFERFQAATGDETRFIENLPRFSTDIVAAWLVVEHLMSNRDFQLVRPARNLWHCSFRPDGYLPDAGTLYMASADSAPLAICKAALQCVEGTARVVSSPERDAAGGGDNG